MKNFTRRLFVLIVFSTFISFTVNAQTHIKGGIYSNTTWTKALSPYIVDSLTVVFPNVTLTIQPGVTVKFADGVGLEVRTGTLIAVGTNSDQITFTSNTSSAPSSWGEINLNGAFGNRFNFCNFYYATNAIDAEGTDSIPVRNSNFISNENGLYGLFSNGQVFIDSCSFKQNSGMAVASGASVLNLINHSIFSNNNTGINGFGGFEGTVLNCIIDSNQYGASPGGCTLSNCIFVNNGIGASNDGISNYFLNCTFRNNGTGIDGSGSIIQNCSFIKNQIGIQTHYDTPAYTSISYCDIDSNTVLGALLTVNSDGLTNCEVKNNGIGIEISDGVVIATNDIENDSIGIQLDDNFGSVYCNKICGNTSYDLFNNNNSPTNVASNYWCTTDSATVAAHIKDGYDDVTLGLVTFTPFDTIGCYLTGCNLILSATVTNATCDTCHTGSAAVNVTNGTGTLIYTWQTSPIQSTQTATGLASGTYSVCVTDGKGCTACKTNVFVDSSNCTGFAASAHASHATCASCVDGIAWLDVSNGSSPLTYTWIPNISTHAVDSNLAPGTYTICARDLYGCLACDTVTVGVGDCSAHFDLYPDNTTPHHYIAVNRASGAGTLHYDWNWGDASAHDTTALPAHTYAAAGTYSITLSIRDADGCTDSYSNSFYLARSFDLIISVTVIAPVVTGISQPTASAAFHLAPNPANDHFTLSLPSATTKGMIRIYNLLGALEYNAAIEKQETLIDVSAFAQGLYVVEVAANNGVSRQKLVKQ